MGLNKLVMGEEYLKIAMERAAEISLYFSHEQPGTSYQYSENIAGNRYTTPEAVVNGWINSEGHYKNLIGEHCGNVGVGCFQDSCGNHWWALVFSPYIRESYSKSGTYEVTRNIPVRKSLINECQWTLWTENKTPVFGDKEEKQAQVKCGTAMNSANLDLSNFTFSSSDKMILDIDQNGKYIITGAGTATLSAVLKEDPTISFEKEINVEPMDIAYTTDWTLDKTAYIYDGNPKKPKVINTLGLIEGVDYTVEYQNNTEIGNGKVIISGIKNYKGTISRSFSIEQQECDHNYVEVRTDPTCQKLGNIKMICSKCGETDPSANIVLLSKVPHNYTASIKKASTCTASGTKTYTCSMCNDSYTETIPATGHKYSSDWTIDISSTCSTEGSKSHHCTVCGAKKDTTLIPKSEHNYSVKITKAATCTASGVKTYTCSVCNDSYTETIPATGHKYSSDWTIDISPTCSVEGSKSHHCVVCGAKKDIMVIPKSEHNYSVKITKAAICTASGVKTYTCSVCKDSYTETIPAKGHNYGFWTTTNAATCTADGIKTRQCSACGKTETQAIAKIGHKYITTVIKAATCTENGENKVLCSECGESHTESVSAKGHNYSTKIVKPSYEAQGYTLHTCSECGDWYKDNYTDKLVTPNISKVNFTTSSNAVTMSWDKVASATGYRVYRYNTSTKKWQGVANTKNTSYTFTKLSSGTDYSFTIRAYTTENGKDYLSPKYTAFKTTTNPANITKVNFKSSANSVKMSWSKVSGATGYRVYKYNTSTKKWQGIANVKGTSYTFGKLKAGTTYKFTVRAYKTLNGQTYLSPKYKTFTSSTNPATVSFKVTGGSKKATVKWNKVTGATGYKVYYKTSKNGKWIGLKTTNNKTTSYTKTGLTKGKTYYFTVKAYKSVGGKAYSGRYTAKGMKVK